jgi:DnaJ like chaperone protein
MFFGWQGNYGGGNYSSSSTKYRSSHSIENDYKVLEIEPSATDDEVKKAYRKQAMKHHPDKVNHLGEEIRKAAEERFAKLNEAYERIKNARGMN